MQQHSNFVTDPKGVAFVQGSARASRWAAVPAPPPPRSRDTPPTVLDRTAPPAMYHHLPYRMRHHRPYEPSDPPLHHHSTRSTIPYEPHLNQHERYERGLEAVHRPVTRESASQAVELAGPRPPPPVLPRRHVRRAPTNEELAERIAERRRREEARDATFNARYQVYKQLILHIDHMPAAVGSSAVVCCVFGKQ